MGVRPEQYKELIAADPGGPIQSAYEQLAGETVNVPKMISGHELRIWAANFEDDYREIKGAVATSVKAEIAIELIDDPDSLVNLEIPEVKAVFDGLTMSEPARTMLEAMGQDPQPKYPYLTDPVFLQNARDIAEKIANNEMER